MNQKTIPEYDQRTTDNYYDKLRKQIAHYTGRYADLILLAPDLFMLLVRLSRDPRVPAKHKTLLLVGIAWFISPLDLLPEAFLGPLGLLDDLVVAAYILNRLLNHLPPEVVHSHWSGKEDLLLTIRKLLEQADALLGDKLGKLLRKLGLED